MEKPFKLLVAIDASKYATEIFDQLYHRKWMDGTEIRILTVVGSNHHMGEASEQFMHECQVLLDHHVVRLQEHLPNCKIIGECLEGNPAFTIAELASQWEADLIVIGSHGDTGVRPDRVGSVAAAIVNTAPCSVEVIKVCGRECKRSHVHAGASASHS